MDIKKLQDIEKIAPKLASEIADSEIVCRIDKVRDKTDKHGRTIVELTLYCKDYGVVVSAYSPIYVRELVKALKNLGIATVQDMVENCYRFRRYALPQPKETYTSPYPRFIPAEVVDCKEVYS